MQADRQAGRQAPPTFANAKPAHAPASAHDQAATTRTVHEECGALVLCKDVVQRHDARVQDALPLACGVLDDLIE
jgi:hypothetical protein